MYYATEFLDLTKRFDRDGLSQKQGKTIYGHFFGYSLLFLSALCRYTDNVVIDNRT